MKKKSITKEYNLLEREDVEKAVYEMVGHPVNWKIWMLGLEIVFR